MGALGLAAAIVALAVSAASAMPAAREHATLSSRNVHAAAALPSEPDVAERQTAVPAAALPRVKVDHGTHFGSASIPSALTELCLVHYHDRSVEQVHP